MGGDGAESGAPAAAGAGGAEAAEGAAVGAVVALEPVLAAGALVAAGAAGGVTPGLLAPCPVAPDLSLLFSPAVSRIDFGCDAVAWCVPM